MASCSPESASVVCRRAGREQLPGGGGGGVEEEPSASQADLCPEGTPRYHVSPGGTKAILKDTLRKGSCWGGTTCGQRPWASFPPTRGSQAPGHTCGRAGPGGGGGQVRSVPELGTHLVATAAPNFPVWGGGPGPRSRGLHLRMGISESPGLWIREASHRGTSTGALPSSGGEAEGGRQGGKFLLRRGSRSRRGLTGTGQPDFWGVRKGPSPEMSHRAEALTSLLP